MGRTFLSSVVVQLACLRPLCAQLDSLRALLDESRGVERAALLDRLAIHYLEVDDNVSALHSASAAYQTARNFGDSLLMVNSGRHRASALRNLGQIDSAIVVYQTLLPVAARNNYDLRRVDLLNGYALALTFKAQYDKALAKHLESLGTSEAIGDTSGVAITLNNIGLLYYKLRDPSKALRYYLKCYALKEKIGDTFDLDVLMNNVGLCYIGLNSFDSALYFIHRALETCGQDCRPQRIVEINFSYGLANLKMDSTHHRIAEKYFLKSLRTAQALQDVRFQLDNIYFLTCMYIQDNRLAEAAVYLRKGEGLFDRDIPLNAEKANIYSNLAELNLRRENFERASHYQRLESRLKEIVFNEDLSRNLMRVEADRIEKQNAAKVAEKDRVLALQGEIIRRQNWLNVISVFLVVTIVCFLVVLLRSYQQKRKVNRLLSEKVAERTGELKTSTDLMLKEHFEREVMMQRALHTIGETIKAVDSLCAIARKETSDPLAQLYFGAIERAIHLAKQ
jgi:tetratricopeptide (TPR) repeat protein